MNNTIKNATGKWYGILTALGVPDHFLQNRHGECPLCGGSDRYRWDDKNGEGGYFCSQCGPGFGIDLLTGFSGMDFKAAVNRIDEIIGTVDAVKQKPKKDPAIRLKQVASTSMAAENTPVEMYLNSRGVDLTSGIEFSPAVAYWDGSENTNHPAMLCRIVDVNGRPLTYHVTYLTPDGGKAAVKSPKKILPPIATITGGAIRLGGMAEHIGVAEGVETALSVTQLTSLICWATVSSGGMESFELPDGVKRVTVFGDNDASWTGQKAAYVLAWRLNREAKRDGRELELDVTFPPDDLVDFNDELCEMGY